MTYEAGWGKKLSYVIAFAWDHMLGIPIIYTYGIVSITTKILDVTKRYTRKWNELKQRRTIVDEDTLANIIHKFNADMGVFELICHKLNFYFYFYFPPQRPLTPARADLLRKRVADEYVELENFQLQPTTLQEDELQVTHMFFIFICTI
jgi:hypothetical protein